MPSGITARPARRPWSTCFAASPWCSSGRWATKAPAAGIGSTGWAGGGPAEGPRDRSGRPRGGERLEVLAGRGEGGGDTVSRRATFGVTGFQTLATAAAVAQPADLFDGMSEPQLDELYGPLIYLMSAGEQGVFSSLSVEGQRSCGGR